MKQSYKSIYAAISTMFYSGLISRGPGTWGSLAAIPPGLFLFWFGGIGTLLLASFIVFFLGWYVAAKFSAVTRIHDDKRIVIDEVVGQWITLAAALYLFGFLIISAVIAFILFRFFDILKPWPIFWCDQKLKNAFGIMLDDVLAACYAIIVMIGLHYAGFS